MPVKLFKSKVPFLFRSAGGNYYLRIRYGDGEIKKALHSQDGSPIKNFDVAK